MREIQVVGAIHAISVPTFVGREVLEVQPPADFIETLGLDAKDKVALELFPGARNLPNHYHELFAHAEPKDFESQREYEHWLRFRRLGGGFFFRELGDHLDNSGIAVYEIDDRRLAYELGGQIAQRLGTLGIRYGYHDGWTRREQAQYARTRALAGYVDSTLREDHMFANLANTDANVVILGRAHADRLSTDAWLQESLGVKVAETWYVEPCDEDFWPSPFSRTPVAGILRGATPAELQWNARNAAIQRELERRRHNAFSIGRILNQEEPAPDFLGHFYISGVTEESLFELAIEERDGHAFQGTIRDVCGNATVEGEISSDGISFLKTYDVDMCDPDRTFLPLHYSGKWRDDMGGYDGRYTHAPEEQQGYGGGKVFWMVPFSKRAVSQLDYFTGWLPKN